MKTVISRNEFLFYSDAFDYPYGPLWTVVVGEHDRTVEEGSEHRIMVEKIFLHERFKEYHHDIGNLSKSNLPQSTRIFFLKVPLFLYLKKFNVLKATFDFEEGKCAVMEM